MKIWILSLSVAYLLGSVPFGYLLVRVFRKEDIRQHGSGNIGATNVARSGAKWLGLVTLLLDLGKGFAAVAIAQHFAPGLSDLAIAAAVVAVVGHVFPVWLGFRGGKGVATALGVLLALSPASGLAVFALFLIVFLLTRYVSLASIVGAIAYPLFALYFLARRTPTAVCGFVFLALLVIVKHHANIRRLLSGTESRFGSRSDSDATGAAA